MDSVLLVDTAKKISVISKIQKVVFFGGFNEE